jgi:peptidoglycan/LPS O-acetylase OafA/YrhL
MVLLVWQSRVGQHSNDHTNEEQKVERPELTGITALRFYAALFVLLFHSRFFAEGTMECPGYSGHCQASK